MGVARVALQMALAIVLPLLVQLWDRRRMTPKERARVWTYASWGGSLYGSLAPCMSIFAWFWVTRRWNGFVRVVLNTLWALGLGFAVTMVSWGADRAMCSLFKLRKPILFSEALGAFVFIVGISLLFAALAFVLETARECHRRWRRSGEPWTANSAIRIGLLFLIGLFALVFVFLDARLRKREKWRLALAWIPLQPVQLMVLYLVLFFLGLAG